ncbi:unnamed protein product [Rotaria sp. Silwood2]|nr:unnamed protein product [Rotaria sp. Silwood2]
MSTPPIGSDGDVKKDELQNDDVKNEELQSGDEIENELQNGDEVQDEVQNEDEIKDELQNDDGKEDELQNEDEIQDELQNDDGKEDELQNNDEAKNEAADVAVSHKPITTDSATIRNSLTSSSITFYVLRHAEPNHGWKIQALFDNDIKFDFESSKALNVEEWNANKNEKSPFLYQLRLNVLLNDRGEVYIQQKKKNRKIQLYQLRISAPGFTYTSHYEEDLFRDIIVGPSTSHQFLFDTRFNRGLLSIPPGSSIPFLDHLCIFTYFLLSTQSYDKVDSLFDQFAATLESRKIIISRESLKIFFSLCYKYLSTIENALKQDLDALKILIRMIGLLSISRENLIFDQAASIFASIILKNLCDKLDAVLTTINENDWTSFCQGLVTLICIKLLHQGNENEASNTIDLLSRMPEGQQRKDAVLKLLDLFYELQCRLSKNKVMELYTLVEPDDLALKYLELAVSIEIYIDYLTYFLKIREDNTNDFQENIKDQLDRLLEKNYFPITLFDIAFILTYLKQQTDNKSIQLIQSVFQTNNTLRSKIESDLNRRNYNISTNEFPLIRDIMIRSYNSFLLHNINRQQYLLRTLNRRNDRTSDYFLSWFECFLCEIDEDWINYQELTRQWTECFVTNKKMLSEVMEKVDSLIDLWTKVAPNNNQRSNFFVTHMVAQCFRQENVNDLLMSALRTVNNEKFLEAFEKQYEKDKLANVKGRLRDLYDPINPLFQLMNIAKEQKRQNKLVENLIALAASMIEIKDIEIVNDTFNHPSRDTFIYAILFDESFNSLSIHETIINRLNQQWMKWDQGNILASDVRTWEKFSGEQKAIVHKIWSLVAQKTGQQDDIDLVFDVSRNALKRKLETNDKVITCLNTYCQEAIDKEKYDDIVKNWHERFELENINSIDIPSDLSNIVPLAEQLNPYATAIAWRTYLDQQTRPSSKNRSVGRRDLKESIERQLSEEMEDDTWSQEQVLSADQIPDKTDKSTNETVKIECLRILQQAVTILQEFEQILKHICEKGRQVPIENILRLFSDIGHAESDLKLLIPLLNKETLPLLLSVTSFWKDHIRIRYICTGIMNLSTKISGNIDLNFLRSLRSINEQTSSEICFSTYEQYREQFEKKCSVNILTLLSYYGSSWDLFDFLDSLTADDVYNLQEAVNDWDETLVNTKTIFDFATVKNFLDRANTAMTNKQKQLNVTSLSFEHIVECFENTWKNNQFDGLSRCLESSALSLASIKRIHLELTDKEQSKRRRIADILQKSNIDFVRSGHHETTFDIDVELPNQQQQTTMNDEQKEQKITFADLSELRDRARLLEYSSNVQKADNNERDVDKLRNFIQFVSVVETTLETLTILYTTGHPSVSKFLIPEKQFPCTDGNYDELKENNTILSDLLVNWEKKLFVMYEIHIDLTYFTSDQFWLIEDYIYNPSSVCHPGYHLLRFIDIDPKLIPKPDKQPNTPEDRLENLGNLLSKLRQEVFYQKENLKNEKILLVETTNEGILRAILSLFQKINIQPHIRHLFYCTTRTNWIEIRGFIYRCFYSQSFHQLIRPELLSQSIQDQFVRLLRSLMKEKPDQNFRIGIITTTNMRNQQLINGLRSMRIVDILRDQDLLNKTDFQKLIQDMNKNCILVTSRITGLGKSTIIRQAIEKSNKKYVKFPIYGDFDVDTLAERLRSKYSQLQTGDIHLDIGTTANSQQLNEILYCLLLFRNFRFGYVAVSVPAETIVYIELDASPDATLNELPLFQHITPSIIVEKVDWTSLNIGNKEIQAVANYLKAIDTKAIMKQNVNSSMFQNLDVKTCSRLIQGPFLPKKDDNYITWTQLSIFVAVFHRLFTGFSHCGYFLVESVPEPQLRLDLVQILLESSNQFTSLSVEAVRKQQRSATSGEPTTFSDAIVRWDTIQPFTLVFTVSDEPLFVYKKPTDVPQALVKYFKFYYQALGQNSIMQTTMFPDYITLGHDKLFLKLASLSRKYFNKSICPKCFRQYDIKQQKCDKCLSKDTLMRPKSFDHKDVEQFQLDIAKKLETDYVLTPDNFIKMLLIYMRVQSGIPVLIMGETGCGKTSLIQFLCQKVLDEDLEIFRIHAGVTADIIINKMNSYIQKVQTYTNKEKSLWIFFDEFNTTPNIGLLKEIMCERTLLGESLPDKMVFLGACNPRRQKTAKILQNDNVHVGLRKNRYEMQKLLWAGTDQRLLYTVVPIPETMLEYIWDYGYLNESTELAYIKTMLNICQHLSSVTILFDLVVNLLVQSQNHFRQIEDASSVSLRDIARFCRLYNWFLNSLIQRNVKDIFQKPSEVIIRRASLIALMLCYYFRLRSVELQNTYIKKMQSIIATQYPKVADMPDYLTTYILQAEQKKLIDDRMEVPPSTARNRALRDNVFVLLACIVNRIPLFLCGKPGSSKSSAVQILISNLKGKKSKDPYFQTLPELVAVSFQGSQNCTSESIVKVFERASKYAGVRNDSEILPVIVFDEIGLAELSPHNPLKVLHAELEVDNSKYGFVGVSNWRLDASKMNRALYLSTPDPDVKDLQLTGWTIARSMQQQAEGPIFQLEEFIINSLSRAYYDLYEHLKETQPDFENYFGLRDYYSLIKGIARDTINLKDDNNKLYEIIRNQLKINFDGIFDGSTFLWQQFCNYINKQNLITEYTCPPFNYLLDQTLRTRSSRYLMLIADSDGVIDYVERYISVHQQKQKTIVRTIVGSSFSGDLRSGNTYAEDYNYRILMDVILYAETNITLIMRQMGHLYDNLYDLFNQNFAISARKKYCRIALGALYHPRCLVHDDFYCVVFIHKRDLDQCDPPFLNRFEKHIIDIQALIHPRHWSLSRQLYTWLDNFLPKNLGNHFPLLQHLFVDHGQDQICNLVIEAFEQLNILTDEEEKSEKIPEIINYCQEKLLHTSSFDLPLTLSIQSTPECQNLIQKYYDIRQPLTFGKLIEQSLENVTPSLQIVYTYTQIYHTIDNLPNDVEEVKLSAFRTELELVRKVKRHYQALTNIRLLLIRVDYHGEHQHILSLKHVIQNECISSSDRTVWLIFHLQRNLVNQVTNDVLFSGWLIDMIDNLNDRQLISKEVLTNPSYHNLVLQQEFRLSECVFDGDVHQCLTKFNLFDNIFDELVDRCLSKFRYINFQAKDEEYISERRYILLQHIIEHRNNSTSKSLHLRSIIIKYLMILIEKLPTSDKTRFVDWRLDILTNAVTIAASRSFDDAFQVTVSMFYEAYLSLLLAHLEKYQLFDAYIFLANSQDDNIQDNLSKLWIDSLKASLETIDVTAMNLDVIDISFISGLQLPCAAVEFENIRSIRKKFQELQENDNESSSDEYDSRLDQMHTSNIYDDKFLQLIFNDQTWFQLYFHDQIAMHLAEVKIQLSTDFVVDLLTSNPTRTIKQYKRLFLVEHVELTEILRLFEISLQLISEEQIRNIIKEQWIEIPPSIIQSSEFYTLVLINSEQFYQLPPKTKTLEQQSIFECRGDPMIETSLMNLIELIVSPSVIQQAKNIQQITTTYSLIAQGIRDLDSYDVNNLEKLRSFLSFIRCLTTLLPHKALDVLKDVCMSGFDAKFHSCSSIHYFITQLQDRMKSEQSTVDENIIHRALVKLELDFLKDWLADNGDSYGEILALINDGNNDLWFYSAKIFTIIDNKLDLTSTLKENHGNLPSTDEYQQLNQSLEMPNTSTRKIERLMVNRLHMHLMLSVQGNEIDQQLTDEYEHFVENVRKIQSSKKLDVGQRISLLAWIKYYAQMYAFALNNDSREDVLYKLDRFLTDTETPSCSTLKLFIIKQILQMSKLTLEGLREVYVNRNLLWIKPFFQRSRDQQTTNVRQTLIIPMPLFQCREQFVRIQQIFNSVDRNNQLRKVIQECHHTQKLSYAFLCWFIEYCSRFIQPKTEIDADFIRIIQHDFSQDLIKSFTPLGHRFLIDLCSNFSEKSYFQLHSTMTPDDIHKRLLALNIVAVFISFKAQSEITLLGNILFDNQRQMPASYVQHLSTICLPGLTISNIIISQMIYVRARVQERLDQRIYEPYKVDYGKFIYQCSKECPWMFYFEDCGAPTTKTICSLCQKEIGAKGYNILIERDPPQLRIPNPEAFQRIDKYIKQENQNICFGYHNVKNTNESSLGDKPDHLNRPVSFRFIHFLTHGLLYFLYDRNYLTDDDLKQRLKLPRNTHFRDHFEKDYELLCQTSIDPQQCYIWLYKLLNHLVDDEFVKKGQINTNENVLQIEQLIEQKLIFKHIDSIDNEITEYKKAHAEFIQKQQSLESFIDELFENEECYPLLNFFNITTFHTSNPLEEFILKMQNLPFAEKTYPVTTYLLKRLDDYTNIQHLYPIVTFSNYLIEKLNHRIKRIDSVQTKMIYYLTEDNDRDITKKLFDDFLDAWYSLTFKEVCYGCQRPKFEHAVSKEKFADNTSIAMLLLTSSRDDSILLPACLKTIAELQNEIVNYFRNTIETAIETTTKSKRKSIPLQSIRPEHIFSLNRNNLSAKLINDSIVVNYQYGKSKDIIYDYEEMEITFRNMISKLVLIDTEKLNFLTYQFELYGENTSLINEVRARIRQQQLTNDDRTKLSSLINTMNHDDILHYLGSLDNIFTYIRTIAVERLTEDMTIQLFVERFIRSKSRLNDNVLRWPHFCAIQLKYIIDFYEIFEEIAFDKVLRVYMKKELVEDSFTDEERKRVIDVFSRATFEKEKIAETLKSIDAWISTLKRLIVRVLNTNIGLDIPLEIYLGRTDLWSDRVSLNDLTTFEVDEDILLQHTYVILTGLENKQKAANRSQQQPNKPAIQSVGGQRQKANTWYNQTAKATTSTKEIGGKKPPGKKARS